MQVRMIRDFDLRETGMSLRKGDIVEAMQAIELPIKDLWYVNKNDWGKNIIMVRGSDFESV